jgi:hypothetical protein
MKDLLPRYLPQSQLDDLQAVANARAYICTAVVPEK